MNAERKRFRCCDDPDVRAIYDVVGTTSWPVSLVEHETGELVGWEAAEDETAAEQLDSDFRLYECATCGEQADELDDLVGDVCDGCDELDEACECDRTPWGEV
jgi:hypothetical protein